MGSAGNGGRQVVIDDRDGAIVIGDNLPLYCGT